MIGRRIVLTSILALALVGTSLLGDDPKPATKHKLPAFWSKLGLTEEQQEKAQQVLGDYQTKIDDLKKQIKALEAEQREKLEKILTEDQKTKLKELAAKKAGLSTSKDKKPSTDKPPEKK
jgi:hypothetical protein